MSTARQRYLEAAEKLGQAVRASGLTEGQFIRLNADGAADEVLGHLYRAEREWRAER